MDRVQPGDAGAVVPAVVLETEGSFSVIGTASRNEESALRNVSGWRD